MATIGLDKLYYATITEAQDTGEETYGTPKKLAEAISVELSVESAEGSLYADDNGTHPWKTEVTEGDTGASAAIAIWYTSVYEPKYTE